MKKKVLICIVILAVLFFVSIIVYITAEKSREKLAEEFLNELYTVNDNEFYKEYLITTNEKQLIDFMSNAYGKYLTEKGLELLLRNRIGVFYDETAYNNNLKFKAEKVSIVQNKITIKDLYQYNYVVTVKVIHNDGNIKIADQIGSFIVKKENNQWKIDYIKILSKSIQ